MKKTRTVVIAVTYQFRPVQGEREFDSSGKMVKRTITDEGLLPEHISAEVRRCVNEKFGTHDIDDVQVVDHYDGFTRIS